MFEIEYFLYLNEVFKSFICVNVLVVFWWAQRNQ